MAEAKAITRKAGDEAILESTTQEQINVHDLAVAVKQLQDTVNALAVAFNAHTHDGVTAGSAASGDPVEQFDGTAEDDADLFVEPVQ